MGVLKIGKVSKKACDNGCYIIKKLCQLWQCEPVHVSGAVGCFYCESLCDPAAYNKAEKKGTFKGSVANGSGYGAGLAQWSLGWKQQIQKMMGLSTPIETWSMDTLIAILQKTCKQKFINQLKNCTTSTQSTDIWLRGYENGGGGSGPLCTTAHIDKYTWCGGYKGAMTSRADAAWQILQAYMGGNVGDDVRGDISYASADDGYTDSAGSGDNGILSTLGNANIYSSLPIDSSSEDKVKHTRIYLAFAPTLKISTMEINIDGTLSPTDSSSNNIDISTNTSAANTKPTNATTNADINVVDTSTGDQSTKKIEDVQLRSNSTAGESLLASGVAYPVIRINDYYIGENTIDKFTISSMGLVPTVELIFTTKDNELIKGNAIKDGDIMAVFIAPTQAAFKSLRCDFLITSFITPKMLQYVDGASYTYIIYGELYISNLYNANLTFSYAGSSRDALMYAALQLKLGFFFNDPENTNDDQMWYCTTEMDAESTNERKASNVKDFIKETTAHAWKNFESFFDSWIDLRYGLTFLNVNKQLGELGPDEQIDATPWQSAVMDNRAADGHRSAMTPGEDKARQAAGSTKPAFKLISNILEDDTATNTYYCIDYAVVNQAGAISREMSVNILTNYVIDNLGVDLSNNSVSMNYSIPYNDWKMKNGFYMLIGPGKNESYKAGDVATEYVDTNTVKTGGKTTDIQADSDAKNIVETGDNMLATGAVNKFYDAGYEHNRINNLQLQKKYVNFTLNGPNFGIMRGEKIPAMILNISSLNKAMLARRTSDGEIALANFIEEDMSGWFIIDGLRYIYDPEHASHGTAWKTEVKCIRREWPISGQSICKSEKSEEAKQEEVAVTIDPSANNVVTGNLSEPQAEETTPADDRKIGEPYRDGSITTEGLEPYMVELWNALNERGGFRLKLGRWYAIDENGQKVNGRPYILNGGLYKVADEYGEIRYLNSEIWDHFYGRAINVTYTNIYNIASDLSYNDEILDIMYKYGISCYIETWKAGGGNVKTLHFGTSTKKQTEFWDSVFTSYPERKLLYGDYLARNLYSKLPDKEHEDVDESTLTKL